MAWKFQIINDWDEVWSEAHLARWRSHMETSDSAHVFFHPALVKAWVETYLPLRRMKPLFVWGNDEAGNDVFFPMVMWQGTWRQAFLNRIIPVGYSDLDYHDPIFRRLPQPESIAVFWRELHEYLGKFFSYDEWLVDGLHGIYLPDKRLHGGEDICPFADLTPFSSIDECLATRSKKARYNILRQQKMNGEKFVVASRVYDASSVEDALESVDLMLDFHRKRWPDAYKAPLFHEKLIRYGLEEGVAHFSTMKFDDTFVSWQLNFMYKSIYYAYMPTINDGYANCSPGRLHLVDCISSAIHHGCLRYDFLRGNESYKSEWAKESEKVYNVKIDSGRFNLVTWFKYVILHVKSIIRK